MQVAWCRQDAITRRGIGQGEADDLADLEAADLVNEQHLVTVGAFGEEEVLSRRKHSFEREP
jgi:hypothetical protein